jgi:PAS domain S-box-containing protein
LALLEQPVEDLGFLSGGGRMGAMMRAHDWSDSPLGPPESWPQSLRTTVSIILNSGHPMFTAWGPELGFLYNDPYTEVLAGKHPAALGARFQDIWGEIWPDIWPLIERALQGRASWREDLPLLMNRHGYMEQTWFTFSYSPVRDESGGVAGMFCACHETTRKILAEQQLQEAAEALQRSERALKGERDRLYALFENAPSFVAAVEGPEHRFVLTNRAYRQLIGWREVVGLSIREALPEIEGQGFFELLDRVYSSGEPFVGLETLVKLQREPGASLEDRYLDFIYQPIREGDGSVSGIFVQGSDVTERTLFNAQQKLLLDELNHRVKNNLATVQSIAAQTARHAPDLQSFQQTYEARLIALSRTHDVLTRTAWESADFGLLVRSELQLYGESRTRIEGPPVRLNAGEALTMGLVLHELATNAAKYGALSTPKGLVTVGWEVSRRSGERRLRLCWTEQGGPQVRRPSRRGFGSRLIERSVRGELGGELDLDYRPEGLRCEITTPLKLAGAD